MQWRGRPSADPSPLARAAARMERPPPPARVPPAIVVAVALAAPAVAFAHERWVPNQPRFPVNRAYFQSMSGEVLLFSVFASIAVFGVILVWYLSAPGIVEALTPVTPQAVAREAARPFFSRTARRAVRFLLDGDVDSAFMRGGLKVATFVFARIPAPVLALGAYQGWLVMPSFPLPEGDLGDAIRIVEVGLAVWAAIGVFVRPLGALMLVTFGYLCFAYDIAAIDAIPVLASAAFYLFRRPEGGVSARQLIGMRVSLGGGFFLLGLVNKIFLAADLFIGVGDQHPDLLIGPQALFPDLTREAWSFTTALGEMVFGLLLLCGVFNRITTLALTFVFANFIFIFGLDEIVHIYPIAGFLLLFFRGSLGTSLDGMVFRLNVGLWSALRHASSRLIYGSAVSTVALTSAALLMFVPLVLITEIVPVMADAAVPANYTPPPLPPPASAWPPLGAAAPTVATKPHADHEPRHGGVVTMMGDLHVEMVVAPSGEVLLYVSDAVRRPIPPSEAKGAVRIERPGFNTTLPLRVDSSTALIAVGPPPRVAANYTYVLQVRGVPVSMTLSVPIGGTDAIVKRSGGAR
jgi:uncharacterized membrane protein YphA (DoxX/SURF4 family)